MKLDCTIAMSVTGGLTVRIGSVVDISHHLNHSVALCGSGFLEGVDYVALLIGTRAIRDPKSCANHSDRLPCIRRIQLHDHITHDPEYLAVSLDIPPANVL